MLSWKSTLQLNMTGRCMVITNFFTSLLNVFIPTQNKLSKLQLRKSSPLSLSNKVLIYNMVLKPIWMYGLELWGCASASNIAIIRRYQAKILRIITNAPRFVTNLTLQSDLRIPQVRSVFKQRIEIHRTALETHPNSLIKPILAQHNRRLKRRWTFDELT